MFRLGLVGVNVILGTSLPTARLPRMNARSVWQHSRHLFAVLLLLVGGCDDPAEPTVSVATRIQVVSGNAQVGVVGHELSEPITVRVTDQDGNALPDITINWGIVQGGGSVQPASSVTDDKGIARTTWTLGSVLGTNHVIEAVAGASVRAEIGATVALPPSAAMTKTNGDGQTGAVTTPLADALEVRLVTSEGAPISGAAVSWSASSASGTVAPQAALTDSDGRASALFTLGRSAGAHQISAHIGDLPAVTFAVTATACPVARLSVVQGDGQSGVAGTMLGTPLIVRVADSAGNPVVGAVVSWSGSGSVNASTTTSNPSGQAAVQWSPDDSSGSQTMTASIGCSSALFSASIRKRVETTAVVPTNAQVSVGASLSLDATLRDEDDSLLSGIPVSWVSVHPSIATVSSSGLVEGVSVGTATIRATAEGVTGQVTVDVIPDGAPGVPVTIQIVGGDGQTGAAGFELPLQLVARVTDSDGNPVEDAYVYWVGEGDGVPFVNYTATTDQGITRNWWTLGSTPGLQRLELYTFDFGTRTVGTLLGVFTATAVLP